jgi:DNA-binding transcriptional MerR regulator/effector-binding domain-containing protein
MVDPTMYSIGRFASIGRVSVRMLRHYDEIGLLVPTRVDPVSGYRSYAPEQLADLAEVMRLRGLGLGLVDIGRVVRADEGDPDVHVLLRSAREALRRSIVADTDRLARFDAYLRRAEGADPMSTIPVEYRAIPAQHVATLTRRAAAFGPEAIGPVVGPMFPEAEALLGRAGVRVLGPAVAVYTADESGDGSGAVVTAGFVVEDDVVEVPGLDVHVLPAVPQAAVATHHGAVAGIADSWMALTDAVQASGLVLSDAAREVYLTPGDRPQTEWVTELVQPVTARG